MCVHLWLPRTPPVGIDIPYLYIKIWQRAAGLKNRKLGGWQRHGLGELVWGGGRQGVCPWLGQGMVEFSLLHWAGDSCGLGMQRRVVVRAGEGTWAIRHGSGGGLVKA